MGRNVSSQTTDALSRVSPDSVRSWLQQHYANPPANFTDVIYANIWRAVAAEDYVFASDLHEFMATWIFLYADGYPADSSTYHSRKDVEYCQKLGDSIDIAEAYLRLATNLINATQLAEAQRVIFEVITIAEEINNQRLLADSYSKLSELAVLQDEPTQAIKYANLALPVSSALEDHLIVANILFSRHLAEM